MDGVKYYVLRNKIPVRCGMKEWAESYEKNDSRIVAKTKIGPYEVSTIFLGVDHGFGDPGPPVLFETMIFDDDGSAFNDFQIRHCTYEEAETVHSAVSRCLQSGLSPEEYETVITKDGEELNSILGF